MPIEATTDTVTPLPLLTAPWPQPPRLAARSSPPVMSGPSGPSSIACGTDLRLSSPSASAMPAASGHQTPTTTTCRSRKRKRCWRPASPISQCCSRRHSSSTRLRSRAGIAALGSTVHVIDRDSRRRHRYRLTGGHEPLTLGVASAGSPMGRALMGRRPGDVVEVVLPRGRRRRLAIKAVEASEAWSKPAS